MKKLQKKRRRKTHIVEIGKQTTNKCIYIQKLHFLTPNICFGLLS